MDSTGKRRNLVQRYNQEDIPSFLHNSPFFLPVVDTNYDTQHKRHHQPRPTLLQILKAKPTRTAFAFIAIALILLFLRSHLLPNNLWARISGPRCYFSEPLTIPTYHIDQVNWSQYAYVQYATSMDYLCNSVMLFERLNSFGSRAERVLMFRDSWVEDENAEAERLLLKKAEEFNVTLIPVQVQHRNLAYFSGPNWSDSYTKLLAFNLTQYTRILFLDSDSTLLSPLDELFLLPSNAPISVPRAYWLPKPTLASHIMLLTPSISTFKSIQTYIQKGRVGFYDMEIINLIFGSSCSIIPHRNYALLTGEFRNEKHAAYLGEKNGKTKEWSPEMVMEEAKFVHFSDFPLDKPWVATTAEIEKLKPACVARDGWGDDCRGRNIWLDLYKDFQTRRTSVCGL